MFERFTERARRCIYFARQSASEYGSQTIETEHLLLGLLWEDADVIGRFLNMGVEPYNFVSALNCILAQRLVRLICDSCRTEVHYPPEVLEASGLDPAQWGKVPLYEGPGCIECAGTGFRGRTAIHELLDLSDRVREMIRTTPLNGFVGCASALADHDYRSKAGTVAKRVLFIVGEKDGTTPAAMRQLHETVSGSGFVELKGAGHISNLDQPEAFTGAMREFLRAA